MPPVANNPPIKVVNLIPILSVRIPAIGERKKVVPIVREPTRAGKTFINMYLLQNDYRN